MTTWWKALLQYVCGPEIYATLRPKVHYEPNMLESAGNKMLYASQVLRAIAWPTSPIWLYYLVTRYTWSSERTLHYICWIITWHSIAYLLRTSGRLTNPTYRNFLPIYTSALDQRKESAAENLRALQDFDYQVNDASKALL